MFAYRSEDMRWLDESAGGLGIPPFQLMTNAAHGIASWCEELIGKLGTKRLLVLAGKGNNGGDAIVAAGILARKGYPVSLCMTADGKLLKGAAAQAWQERSSRITLLNDWSEANLTPDTLVLDGILGTGIHGEPRGIAAEWIARLNQNHPSPILAIDVPSGLDADTGDGMAVHADFTASLVAPKLGMFLNNGPACCGRLRILPIGMPDELIAQLKPAAEAFGDDDVRRILQRESIDTFKNRRGHTVIIGSSTQYPHAPFLSGEAALRAGAGLVTVMTSEKITPFCRIPAALIVRMPQDKYWSPAQLDTICEELEQRQALALGPGLGKSPESDELTRRLLKTSIPLVLDADGLNCLAAHPEYAESIPAGRPLILTPHLGEMRRLTAAFNIQVLTPAEQAAALASRLNAVIVLKGCRTIVAEPNGRWTYNLTGAPTLATAGSGDVLTGLCASFLAQGYAPQDAARVAVCLHGRFGELASPCGSRGVIADDLLPLIQAGVSSFSERL